MCTIILTAEDVNTSSMTPHSCTIYVEHDGRRSRRHPLPKKEEEEDVRPNNRQQENPTTTNIVDL
jgi:hypothetical protein